MRDRGPAFDRPIASGGYQWHYVDGLSDDGLHAIVVIALLGNPFSGAYARARNVDLGTARAHDFAALNVAIYGPRAAWTLRDRRTLSHENTVERLVLGASSVFWEGDRLVLDLDERSTPFGGFRPARPIRGRIVFEPQAIASAPQTLDRDARHSWWPVAPLGRIDVALSEPALRFSGHGYHDANAGDAPLEASFRGWTWARARTGPHAHVVYDVTELDGTTRTVALTASQGAITTRSDLARHVLPRSRWGIARQVWADPGARVGIRRSLEDGPFYTRDLVSARIGGDDVVAVHETLSGTRLAERWVRFLAGFRSR